MGWFDNDPKANTEGAAQAPAAAAPAAPAASPVRSQGGSTLGERVHIKGKIVSNEDLTILGKVEGTIRTRQRLTIAKEAEIKAVIHGRTVLLEGAVNGDIHASESLVLGATASLVGNISTPSLHIVDGAYFKGGVEMRQAATKPERDSVRGSGSAVDYADRGRRGGQDAPRARGRTGGGEDRLAGRALGPARRARQP